MAACTSIDLWMGQSSLQVDVDHARLDTISERHLSMELEKVHSVLTTAALRPVLVGRSNIYIYYPNYSSCPATPCYAYPSTMSSSQWSTLPVEIQLTITQLLDNKTLRSLSEVSHHNRILSLPAVYSVRSYSPSPPYPHSRHPTHIHTHSHAEHMYLVGHHTIVRQAPIFPGSRASPPCVPHSHTRHQHRWLLSSR
jgi:hypothetical protein